MPLCFNDYAATLAAALHNVSQQALDAATALLDGVYHIVIMHCWVNLFRESLAS